MHKHEPNGTRITVERISVTTVVRRNRSQKVYCDICKQELAPHQLTSQMPQVEGEREMKLIGPARPTDEETN